ncbi:unnamed protein product [Dracunculus medinensis]|uniref:Zinc_ribbon_16 domain-containing protein n=1 Tax=Dracunculus medinensis TaxID=318479 RepID=A0A0N4U6Y3_DRAME|nr:unnamed protein product [Dracunculus medinensis]
MNRNVRWLHGEGDRFFVISAERFGVFSAESDFSPKLVDEIPLNNQSKSDQDRLRCFDLSILNNDNLALGYQNGKILVSKLAIDPDIRTLKNSLELNVDVSKPVSFLRFSPIASNYLAACFEGGRTVDYSLFIYDLNRIQFHPFRLNTADRINCSTWFSDDLNMLVVGCNRTLKLFDIREGTHQTYTKSMSSCIRALSSDSFNNYRFACMADDALHILDRRRLSSTHKIPLPDRKKNDSTNVELSWNPTTPNHLTFLRHCARSITDVLVFSDKVDNLGKEESRAPKLFGLSRISGFNWHPVDKYRLLLTGPEEASKSYSVRIVRVKPFVCVSSSPQGYIASSVNNELRLHEITPILENYHIVDIGSVMHQRAIDYYGCSGHLTLGSYIGSCKEVIDDCPFASSDLKWVWKWLFSMLNIVDWKYDVYGTWFPGILQIMQKDTSNSIVSERISVSDLLLGPMRIYRSKERSRILRYCEWPSYGNQSQLDAFVDENFAHRATESRAVAAALFFGNSLRMKNLLNTMIEKYRIANDNSLVEVEIFYEAIVQYKGIIDHWRSVSEGLRRTIRNPYFKMILTFLTGYCDSSLDLTMILHQEDIPLEDRIAFGALHLNDQLFVKGILSMFNETDLHMKLQGLFIVGLTRDIDTHILLGKYVDNTGDVQTASIMVIIGKCLESTSSDHLDGMEASINDTDLRTTIVDQAHFSQKHIIRTSSIICEYREMLNNWSLWIQRGRIDGLLLWQRNMEGKLPLASACSSEVEICCPFCRKGITVEKYDASSDLPRDTSKNLKTAGSPQLSSAKFRNTRELACQNCLKPLPKCVLCRGYMGSTVAAECADLGRSSSWFSWCQVCRHGGHISHLRHWFRSRSECPATGCMCKCQDIDTNISGSSSGRDWYCNCDDP